MTFTEDGCSEGGRSDGAWIIKELQIHWHTNTMEESYHDCNLRRINNMEVPRELPKENKVLCLAADV